MKKVLSIILTMSLCLSLGTGVYAEEDLRPVVGLDAKVVNETASEDVSKSMSAAGVSITYSENDKAVDVYGTRADAATNGEGSATSSIEVKGNVFAMAEGDQYPCRVWGVNSNTETGLSVEGIIGRGDTTAKTTVEGDVYAKSNNYSAGIHANTQGDGISRGEVNANGNVYATLSDVVEEGNWPETVGVYAWSGSVFDDNTSVSLINIGKDVTAITDIKGTDATGIEMLTYKGASSTINVAGDVKASALGTVTSKNMPIYERSNTAGLKISRGYGNSNVKVGGTISSEAASVASGIITGERDMDLAPVSGDCILTVNAEGIYARSENKGDLTAANGAVLAADDNGTINVNIGKGGITASGAFSRGGDIRADKGGTAGLTVEGNIKSDNVGLALESDGTGKIDALVLGTLSGKDMPVEVFVNDLLAWSKADEEFRLDPDIIKSEIERVKKVKDSLSLTLWKADLDASANGCVVAGSNLSKYRELNHTEEGSAALDELEKALKEEAALIEKNIRYVIKLGPDVDPNSVNLTDANGKTLEKSHGYYVAKAGEPVYMDGSYILTVPKGGGVYLADMSDGKNIGTLSPDSPVYEFDSLKNNVAVAGDKVDMDPYFSTLKDFDGAGKHKFVSSSKKAASFKSKSLLNLKKRGKTLISCRQKGQDGKWTDLSEKRLIYVHLPKMVKKKTVSLSDTGMNACEFISKTAYLPTEWKSSNESVATIDSKGVMTFIKPGKTTIYAVYGQSKKKYKTKLTIKN